MKKSATSEIGFVTTGDVRNDEAIAAEILDHMDAHGVLSVVMTDRIIGCPHQTGIDYEGDWCPDPACVYWRGRDRFTGKHIQSPPDALSLRRS